MQGGPFFSAAFRNILVDEVNKVCLHLLLTVILVLMLHLLSFLAQRRCEFPLLHFLDFQRIKTKVEKRELNSAKVSIQQVPARKSILVSGLSEKSTRDSIQLHFESRRNSGGPVESVQFVPKSGRAVVVFQDPEGL